MTKRKLDLDQVLPVPSPEVIHAARMLGGYNKVRFAELVGVERSTIHRWERGDTKPRGQWLEALVRVIRRIHRRHHRPDCRRVR